MKNYEAISTNKNTKEQNQKRGKKVLRIFEKLRRPKKQEIVDEPAETFPPDEATFETNNKDVRRILNKMPESKVRFLAEVSKEFASADFPETPDLGENNLSFNDAEELKRYTGIEYKYINSVLRGFWNYDELGRKTPEREAEVRDSADRISEIIKRTPKLHSHLKTYRGTNLDSFRGYGAENLEDLKNLDGQFFFEPGFTSASLSREDSFFDREFEDTYRKKDDIEIEILLPSGAQDGIALNTNDLSYSKSQKEYLIDKGSLFRIMNVETNGETAKLTMVLIPKEFADDNSWD